MPAGFTERTFAASPGSLKKPDDITELGGHVFVAYQNGVGSKGEPAKDGRKDSTVVEYSSAGVKIGSWNVTGKIDGMTADTAGNRIVATVNEDGNSSMYVIVPGKPGKATQYTYSPSKLVHGGGTDAITFDHGVMYVTASAPTGDASGKKFTSAALYSGVFSGTTVKLTPVVRDNVTATDSHTGKRSTLNMSDPDSSTLVPPSAPKFAGDFVLDSQGDSELVLLPNPAAGGPATVVSLSTQVDDTQVATSGDTTLLVTDGKTNQVLAITGPFKAGTAYSSVPDDSKPDPSVIGTVDLATGKVTPWVTGLGSPKGLLFLTKG